ncbi:MAG TPA: glucose-6-phosphate dehydrogenase [Actinomycetales bacterium]|nr:glucose-6-phosphate dehydrogenase [Actinomycetales bacterium]
MQANQDLSRLVLCGGTGDLATRHLLPALAQLLAAGAAPSALKVAAVGPEPMTTQEYRGLVARSLERHPDVQATAAEDLLNRLEYHPADLLRSPSLAAAVGAGPVIAYLALPPAVYAPAVRALQEAGIHADSRIAVEKPFGQDAPTARALTELLHRTVPERNVFRIDHFLHHQTVHNVLALRLANRLFEPLWRREHVEQVEITWEETGTAAGRGAFYDGTGALRDMVQSHLLQLLALVAMDLPQTLDERGLRDAKVAALRAVRADGQTVRGRYTAGVVRGRPVGEYLAEPGVVPERATETYTALRLWVDVDRWAGVPFLVRTGKALGEDRRSVVLRFRPPPGSRPDAEGDALRIEMVPDRLALDLQASGPQGLGDLAPVRLVTQPPRPSLPPSARLLQDLLRGDPTLAVRDDEAEQCWRVVDAVLAGWRTGTPPLRDYAAGSAGPVPPGEPHAG